MHTITGLRKALGLSTANQVRNRIEAVRDVLEPHLRRGPNNQILLTDEGLAVLRQLQELYDSGLRMNEASDVIRASAVSSVTSRSTVSPGFAQHQAMPSESRAASVRALEDEIAFLRTRLVALEAQLTRPRFDVGDHEPSSPWWTTLREDLDVA
ncbi:MAG: hypothetical protein NTX23_03815 [Candidatus Bipolaricaulota bacterium]|nr:hypothetical protein [Candidatus Bipolaricaulota bacterium]